MQRKRNGGSSVKLQWAIIGIVALLIFKYVFFGLRIWDELLHPGRTDDSAGMFYDPFFGLFMKGESQ
jgi:hypothetical protein